MSDRNESAGSEGTDIPFPLPNAIGFQSSPNAVLPDTFGRPKSQDELHDAAPAPLPSVLLTSTDGSRSSTPTSTIPRMSISGASKDSRASVTASSNRLHEAALRAITPTDAQMSPEESDRIMAQALIEMEEEAVKIGRARRASVAGGDSLLVNPRERRASMVRRQSSLYGASSGSGGRDKGRASTSVDNRPTSNGNADALRPDGQQSQPRSRSRSVSVNHPRTVPTTGPPGNDNSAASAAGLAAQARHPEGAKKDRSPSRNEPPAMRIDIQQRNASTNSPPQGSPTDQMSPRATDAKRIMRPVSMSGEPIPPSEVMPSHVNFYRTANRGSIPHAVKGDDGGRYVGYSGVGRRDLRQLQKDQRAENFKSGVVKRRAKEKAASIEALNGKPGQQGQVAIEVEKTADLESPGARSRMPTPFQTKSERSQLKGIKRYIYDVRRWMRRHPLKKIMTVPIWMKNIKAIETKFGTGIASYFVLARWVFLLNFVLASIWFWFVFVEGFLGMFESVGGGQSRVASLGGGGSFLTFFTGGSGWGYTAMFYGGYSAQALGGTYRLDLAWIFCMFSFFGISFLAIVMTMRSIFIARPYHSSTVQLDEHTPFAVALFTGWDYTLASSKSVKTHGMALSTVLKALITQETIKRRLQDRSVREKRILIAKRVFANICTLVILGLACFLIWLSTVVDASSNRYASLVMSAMNAVFPIVFYWLSKFEQWSSPDWEITMMLSRTYVLKMASIYVVLYGIYVQLYGPNPAVCWENLIGGAFYQLIWLDLIITAVQTVIEAFIYNRVWGRWEFDLPSNTLELVYRQALIWVGSIYSPVVPLLGVVTCLILFYAKYYTLLYFGEPPKMIHNSSKQSFWFLAFMGCTLVLSGFPIWWAMLRIPSSCGPFNPSTWPYTATQGAILVMYDVVPKWVKSLSGSGAAFFSTISDVSFLGPILTFLVLCVFYLASLSKKRMQRLTELEEELFEEREDKRFLMRFYKIQT
ncbi:hypothetical protein SmJEL517_g04855 [Synchytrium microbalum]|uniref:TMC domain-containing protein n=1 Tax=Synchytrium microbalum TaxID=1806994 RepID=A0A507C1S7_9FUNG|nr:uncharacterized protein SmJEL517_g04855 [Synchytrium microbalum]TPX31906.1 hypothetical protein SmJEL517_g04855 [Synchytrium microbalum]